MAGLGLIFAFWRRFSISLTMIHDFRAKIENFSGQQRPELFRSNESQELVTLIYRDSQTS